MLILRVSRWDACLPAVKGEVASPQAMILSTRPGIRGISPLSDLRTVQGLVGGFEVSGFVGTVECLGGVPNMRSRGWAVNRAGPGDHAVGFQVIGP